MDLRLISASHILMFICSTLGTTEVIQLTPDRIYTYSLTVSIRLSNMMIPAENTTYQTLGLRGRASITGTQNCTTLIQVNSLEVSSLPNAVTSANDPVDSYWSPVSQVKNSKPGRFCYENGRILDYHVDAGEGQLSLSFQRSVLSHLQLTARSSRLPTYGRETDISGDCVTKYVPHETSNGTVGFTRTKYTAGCNKKIYFHFLSSADVIQMPTLESKLPTLNGKQECNVRLRHHKVVARTQCEEEFIIHPFGNEADREAVKMTAITDLRLVDTTKTVKAVSLDEGQLRATTLFMSKQSVHNPKRNLSALQIISSLGFSNATTVTPRLFYDLIRQFRGLSQTSLQRLKAELSQVNYAEEFRQAILDGMAHLLPEYQLPVGMDDKTSIDSKETAKFISVKLNSLRDKPVQQVLEQEKVMTLDDLIDILLSKLTGFCSHHSHGHVDEMLVTVSDLSQISGHLSTKRFHQVIRACLRLPSDDVTTRVAIGQLLSDLKCQPDLDALSWNLLRNPQEDIETRIHFYRAYLNCPTNEKLVKILELLESELSEQFRSYVSSHLVNSLSTTAHHKKHFQSLLKPFQRDIQMIGRRMWNTGRSFSKHYEYVYRTEKAAIGFQAHIIFGPESYIPRSIWVNLTLELFGHAFNLVEVNCRSNELLKFERWLASMRRQVFDTEPPASPTRYDEFDKLFERRSRPTPVTSISVRASGKTLLFWQNVTEKLTNVNFYPDNINHLIVNLKSGGHNLLLDSVIQVSTVGGLPLYLNYILSVIDRSNIYTQLKRRDQTIDGNWTVR